MNEKQQLILSSLLHDIGKLGFRAGERGSHEDIGRTFLSQFEDYFEEVVSLISMHHRHEIEKLFEKEGFQKLKVLIIADWLASTERIGLTQKEEISKIGLSPIFSKLSIYEQEESGEETFYYPGNQIQLKDDCEEIFPKPKDQVKPNIERNFEDNWNTFQEHFHNIYTYTQDFDALFDFLLNLLQTHFKFIPSAAYKVEPDISLFDHSKIVCAFCAALETYFTMHNYDGDAKNKVLNNLGCLLKNLYLDEENIMHEIENNTEKSDLYQTHKYFTLIHGDFSGIQDFIHRITSKYAMKTLKGRSFFLSLLTDVLAEYVVEKLELPKANIIFAGGGHFYILAYQSDAIGELLEDLSVKVNNLFIQHYNAQLYLALDYIPLTIKDIVKYQEANVWRKVTQKTSMKKKERYKDVILSEPEKYAEIFGPKKGSAEELERCVICNSSQNLEDFRPSDEESEEKWCDTCKGFLNLTNDLRGARYIQFSDNPEALYNQILEPLDKSIKFIEMLNGQKDLFSINDPTANLLGTKYYSIAFPFKEKGMNMILDNDDLADKAEQRTGFNKLGILKMDIDSLGRIITHGLGKQNSLSRVSTLSTSLSLFFKGYVSELVKSSFKDEIYLIFSGGDDLFAVGAWDKTIEFAHVLYKEFRRFTSYNPNITLSAGLVLVNPKFPIMKASMMAEEALDDAKHFEYYTGDVNTKNKICLFGSVLNWDWSLEKEKEHQTIVYNNETFEEYRISQIISIMENQHSEMITSELINFINDKSEFELAIILKDIFVYLMQSQDFSKSILHKLDHSTRGLQGLLKESLKRRIEVPRLWRLKYYLRKVLHSNEKDTKLLSQFIIQMIEIIIKSNLFESSSHLQIKNIDFISVAIKWADYLTRK
ncbi:MAG: type III-A CRISPR-associated protein Cas10/Csm1 [Candidatus Lokiarchaeota archaeon]|nr:type III-A CRISPR-associated protein Cas10/Csm1 [Candidatus Lokiarchaeota archaeon]